MERLFPTPGEGLDTIVMLVHIDNAISFFNFAGGGAHDINRFLCRITHEVFAVLNRFPHRLDLLIYSVVIGNFLVHIS